MQDQDNKNGNYCLNSVENRKNINIKKLKSKMSRI